MKSVAALLLLAACASNPAPAPSVAPASGAALGTCDNPIVINAKNEDEGIKAEYAWIREHYPGAQRGGQGLAQCNGKPADRIDFTDANGNKVALYFDISGWFGKF